MTKRIHLLPPLIANQIAAGEVVERPASIVKELLENSLDAGATHIDIDVLQGGLKQLRIRDDGAGIDKEDLALALCRHATSKIATIDDLQQLMSLGFRGEALASISSVAKLTLTSCAKGASLAWQVYVEGLDVTPTVIPAAHPEGSTVDVSNLFFNTPARRRFLRSEKTEFFHIEELVKRIALSRFDVSFILHHNQRPIYQLKRATNKTLQENRIAKLCGATFLKQAIAVDFSAIGLRLWGWLGLPDFARSQTDLQFFYINGRIIRDRLINHAIRQAYQDLLFEGRHPSYILFLEVDSKEVDVNVHPTKYEVRFHQGRMVHDFITTHLQKMLRPNNHFSTPLTGQIIEPSTEVKTSHYEQNDTQQYQQQLMYYQSLPLKIPAQSRAFASNVGYEEKSVKGSIFKLIGQWQDVYLLADSPKGLAIIDVNNAKRQIIFQQLQQHIQSPFLKMQPLLVPVSLTVEKKEMKLIEQHQDNLIRVGLTLCAAGPTTLMIKSVVSALKSLDIKNTVKTVLTTLLKGDLGVSDLEITQALLIAIVKNLNDQNSYLSTAEIEDLLLHLSILEEENAGYSSLSSAIKYVGKEEVKSYFASSLLRVSTAGGSKCRE